MVINAPLITYGLGARGYNQYEGTAGDITFESVTTFGDGSVGVQISKAIGKLTVKGDVATHGNSGNSLVKGVNVQLPVIALSIKEGGEVQEINIGGELRTAGDGVTIYSVGKGLVNKLSIGGKISALGEEAKPVEITDGCRSPDAGHYIK